ncbi:radical SAM protein [Nonomuraea sp. NPDC050310]|uniref:radical SAM protein n=1 Tax=Nonomuraea sp. NPDC050310 TaxID=3154935 RepID=UPI0033F547B2
MDAVDERPLIERRSVARAGLLETQARTVIERVPAWAGIPQRWGVSPYRGCVHACRGCGARGAHRRLGLDAGRDFDARIVVKANAAVRLERELVAWGGEELAVGVAGDCYQEAEARYRLMPAIVAAAGRAGVPLTVYTKSPLVVRDAGLLARAGVRVAVSIGFVDERIRREVEPGAVSAQARLELVAALAEAGVAVHVLMGPVLPLLSDGADQLEATVRRIAAAGAGGVWPVVLRLPAATRAGFTAWLAERHPGLVERYEQVYDRPGMPAAGYEARIVAQIEALAAACGMAPVGGVRQGKTEPGQLALI